jgi:hypothetical protein
MLFQFCLICMFRKDKESPLWATEQIMKLRRWGHGAKSMTSVLIVEISLKSGVGGAGPCGRDSEPTIEDRPEPDPN